VGVTLLSLPEPGALLLLASGLLAIARRRRVSA
jgi:MprA protease rhombosortase-interaction domain-containing protein